MKKSYLFIVALFLLFQNSLFASGTATWIWYPGDYEIWLGNEMNNRRTERGFSAVLEDRQPLCRG